MLRGGHLVTIIGDRKSPEPENYERLGLRYYSLGQQRKMEGDLAAFLPENSYARKNLGYLQMVKDGEKVFVETDDDNAPMADWHSSLSKLGERVRVPDYDRVSGFNPINIYALFGQPEVWPRGFPLRKIRNEVPDCLESEAPCEPWVVQGLANGEPDVDAIFRLIHPGCSTTFTENLPVVLSGGDWCPFNSQNTLWRRPAFPLAYLPFTVAMRFTDILRGYVAQACLRAAGVPMVFTGASVWQDRNPHDALKDFADELDFYLRGEEIMSELSQLSLLGEPARDLLSCYERLTVMGVVEDSEISGVSAFISDLDLLSQ